MIVIWFINGFLTAVNVAVAVYSVMIARKMNKLYKNIP